MTHAEAFAAAILDARREAQAHMWAGWIAHAQREAAPLVRAVRVLASRSLDLATGPAPATNEPGLSTERDNPNHHVNNNSHESVTRASRGPRIGRPDRPLMPRGLGPVAERVILSTALDPFLSLKALAEYAGVSVRTLRVHLADATHPLPCYRLPGGKDGTGEKGKVLVRRSEYDAWALRHRQVGAPDVDRLVAEVLRELR